MAKLASCALALALLALGSQSVLADLGFSIGVHKEKSSDCKTTQDYAAELEKMKSLTSANSVRIYSATNCDGLANILPAARKAGVTVLAGVYPYKDQVAQDEMEALRKVLSSGTDGIRGITVGSEIIYRKHGMADDVVKAVNQVRQLLKELKVNVPLGYADTWNIFADGSANGMLHSVDYVLINEFPYWQGKNIDTAPGTLFDCVKQAEATIHSIRPELRVEVGETGWPTAGDNYGAAVASVDNAAEYWRKGVCELLGQGHQLYAFELTDEEWKPCSVGDNGQCSNVEKHWGVLTSDLVPKYDLSCKTRPKKSSTSAAIHPTSTFVTVPSGGQIAPYPTSKQSIHSSEHKSAAIVHSATASKFTAKLSSPSKVPATEANPSQAIQKGHGAGNSTRPSNATGTGEINGPKPTTSSASIVSSLNLVLAIGAVIAVCIIN